MTIAYLRPAGAPGLAAALLALAALAPGCAATATEMRRAEQSYDEARYEAAEVWLADLEPRAPGMDAETRALYFYLRGMTEYRLGQRLRALHYLAVAREVAGERSEGLHPEQARILAATLEELTPTARLSHRPPPAAR